VPEPFRLDLTANVLRRLSTNVVDRYHDGHFQRLVGGADAPALLDVIQSAPGRLDVSIDGPFTGDAASLVRRMLGVDVDLAPFYTASAATPWLADLVSRARGVKPPRYPSLWEAIVNAVVFQQISIHAASAILRRVIEALTPARMGDGLSLFPSAERLANADPSALRALGLSLNKVVSLQRLAALLLDGAIDAAALESEPTSALVTSLVRHPGIGPWTAALIAIRGFGRLDVFPMRDSGVARGLRDLFGDANVDANTLLGTLGAQRGMLYYHLLIARLWASGDIRL